MPICKRKIELHKILILKNIYQSKSKINKNFKNFASIYCAVNNVCQTNAFKKVFTSHLTEFETITNNLLSEFLVLNFIFSLLLL